MARAMTSPELANTRLDGQFSQLYLAVIKPATVLACQLNGLPSTFDQTTTLLYNNITSGSVVNVLPDMTMLVGSTAGNDDLGTVRVVAASGSSIGIAPTSEIVWTNGCYLTVVDEIGLWPKQAKFDNGVFLCSDNQVYTNQHSSFTPVPILGPDQVLYLSGSSVAFSPNAADSWVFSSGSPGTSISSYQWACSGSSVVASGSSVSPTITFYQAGTYRVSCTVTASNGQAVTGYRVYYVYSDANPPITQFILEDLYGDWSDGGWSFKVTAYAQADLTAFRDRAKAFLFSTDYFDISGSAGKQVIAMGPLTGYERILATGWIDGDTLVQNPEQSTATFTVKGPHGWLGKLGSWPAGIKDVSGSPSNWNQFQGLTFDAFAWHVLQWRSTAVKVMDIYPSGETQNIIGTTAPWGTVWDQITSTGETVALIHPCCDKYGRLYLQRDTNHLTAAARASVPTVMGVTKVDWTGEINIERRTMPVTGLLDLRVFWYSSGSVVPMRSLSPGASIGRFGKMQIRTDLYASGSAAANELAGILYGYDNNPLPTINLPMSSKNNFFDICPNQYGTLTVAASDTPRGITLTNQKFVPKNIQYSWNKETGTLLPTITAEGQTTIAPGFSSPMYQGPPISTTTLVPGPRSGSTVIVVPPSASCDVFAPANGPFNQNYTATLLTDQQASSRAYWLCRGAGHLHLTNLYLTGYLQVSVDGGITWTDSSDATDSGGISAYCVGQDGSMVQGTLTSAPAVGFGVRTFQFSPANNFRTANTMITLIHGDGGVGTVTQTGVGAYCTWGGTNNFWSTTGLAWGYLDRYYGGFPYAAAADWQVHLKQVLTNVQQYRFSMYKATGSSEVGEGVFNGVGMGNSFATMSVGNTYTFYSVTLASHTLSPDDGHAPIYYAFNAATFWDDAFSPASHPSSYRVTGLDVLSNGVWVNIWNPGAAIYRLVISAVDAYNICPWA